MERCGRVLDRQNEIGLVEDGSGCHDRQRLNNKLDGSEKPPELFHRPTTSPRAGGKRLLNPSHEESAFLDPAPKGALGPRTELFPDRSQGVCS
jgi:hypothetical protein